MSPGDTTSVLRQAFERCRSMDGSLKDRLAHYAAESAKVLPAYGQAVDRLVARINENGGGGGAPKPGEPMPPFLLPDESNNLVGLDGVRAQGPVAVVFHRGHWCPYCRLNMNALVRARSQIAASGGQVVIITPERQRFARAFKADSGAPFPILTDLDNGYALSLNLAIWLGPDFQELLAATNLPEFHGNNAWMVPIPATFVVGRDGLVKARHVDPDYRRRMAIDDLLAALKAAA